MAYYLACCRKWLVIQTVCKPFSPAENTGFYRSGRLGMKCRVGEKNTQTSLLRDKTFSYFFRCLFLSVLFRFCSSVLMFPFFHFPDGFFLTTPVDFLLPDFIFMPTAYISQQNLSINIKITM